MGTKQQRSKPFFERGSWYHRTKTLQEDGTVKYGKKGGFRSEEAALESQHVYEEMYLDQIRGSQEKKENKIKLFDYLDDWFHHEYAPRVRSSTYMAGECVLNDLILPYLDRDIMLAKATTEYFDNLLEQIAKRAKTEASRVRELLSIAMRYAFEQGYIDKNPIAGTRRYSRENRRTRVLGTQDLRSLLKAARLRNWYLEVLLVTFCGLSKGEVLGLKFSDFNVEKQSVHIHRFLAAEYEMDGKQIKSQQLVERETQGNQNRILFVPSVVLLELEKRRGRIALDKKRRDYQDYGYITCQRNGTPRSLSSFNSELKKIEKIYFLPPVSVQNLREKFAFEMDRRRVPIAKISGILGHESVQTTIDLLDRLTGEEPCVPAIIDREFGSLRDEDSI